MRGTLGRVRAPSSSGSGSTSDANLTAPAELIAGLSPSLGLVLAQESLEEPAVAFLVAQNRDDHVLRHGGDLVGLLDDLRVVVDRTALGLDHALDDMDDVGLMLRRLQIGLLCAEVQRARHDA